MTKHLILIYLFFTTSIATWSFGQSLRGQVFQIAADYSEDRCGVNPECDCCSSDLIFLTDKQFGMIGRCMYNDVYYTGQYSVNDGRLTLKFKPIIVIESIDEETSKVENKKQTLKVDPLTYRISKCGQNAIRFQYARLEGKDLKNGSRVSRARENEVINKLNRSEAWRLLTD
ncbi:MAG: hypothetical protein WKF87_04105 [Chryseolinea sp.]